MANEQNENNPADPTKPEPGTDAAPAKREKKTKELKITEKDFKRAETILKAELAKRKNSQFRQKHERMWKVVDRQVTLDPPEEEVDAEEEWLNAFELGVLAQASEIMTADLLRVIFPDARDWFEAHVEPPLDLDAATGEKIPMDKKMQSQMDGRLRALLTQQHITFGLRDRVELSLKEALHHGAFVAEVDEQTLTMYLSGTSAKDITSPVWVPHSMWNCYPDPSPSLVGSAMFYTGSMFVTSYMPLHKVVEMAESGEGWIKGALKKIPKEEKTVKDNQTKDIELVTYWGDVVIPKSSDGVNTSVDDLYFPNYKAILANGKLIYLNENKTPYPPVIYKCYERMDVRDPYAFSPIIKQSPMQSITSILANEFVNSVQLHTRPPLVYDGNDPDFVVNGGPTIFPGAKSSSKGSSNFKEIKVGDPAVALNGVQFCKTSMTEALGRPGIEVGSRATKAEVDTKQADSEAGPFGFAIKVDDGLRTFLYMQHAMNLAKRGFKFSYYNPDLDSPDFLRVEHKDLPDSVHFEVVGSKGMLGEARRHMAFTQTTAFALGHPAMAAKMDIEAVLKQMYMDAGTKAPERFMLQGDAIPPQVKQQLMQLQQELQKAQAELQSEQAALAVKEKGMELNYEAKMTKTNSQHEAIVADLNLKAQKQAADHQVAMGNQAHELKSTKLEQMIKAFEHTVALTVAKHARMPEEPTEGTMGIVEPVAVPATDGAML